MKLVAATAALLVGTSGIASAGVFGGLGIGTAPATSGVIDYSPDGRSARLQLGYTFRQFTVEGMATRYGLEQAGGRIYDGTVLALAARYNHPLSDGFELFGRLGIQRTSLTAPYDTSDVEASGSGVLVGLGVEYRLKLSFVKTASLFLDYTIANQEVNGASHRDAGMTTRTWTLGFTVGI